MRTQRNASDGQLKAESRKLREFTQLESQLEELLFEWRCRRAASKAGVRLDFFPTQDSDSQGHDDGLLFIIRYGLCACFDVAEGQSLSLCQQDKRTRCVLRVLGLTHLLEECFSHTDYAAIWRSLASNE